MKRGTLSMHVGKYSYEKLFCLFAGVGFYSGINYLGFYA